MRHLYMLLHLILLPLLFLWSSIYTIYSYQLNWSYITKLIKIVLLPIYLLNTALYAVDHTCPGTLAVPVHTANGDESYTDTENSDGSRGYSGYYRFSTQKNGSIRIRMDQMSNIRQRIRIGIDDCNNASIVNIRTSTGIDKKFNVTANQLYYIRIREANSDDEINYRIRMNFTATNQPPVVDTQILDQTNFEGDTITPLDVSGNFSDPDTGDTLEFSASDLPGGLGISTSGTITGTIDNDANDNSPYSVTVTANDGNGGTVSNTFIWTVNAVSSNSNPVVDTQISDQTNDEGDTITPLDVSGNFSDPDSGDTLEFSAVGLPGGLSISTSGSITGTVDNDANDNSPYSVTVTADDGNGGTVSNTFIWTVNAVTPLPYPNEYTCGIFGSVLISYKYIDSAGMNNEEVCFTDNISYPEGQYYGEIPCNLDGCGGTTECERTDPPTNRLEYSFPSNSKSSNPIDSSHPKLLTNLEYGPITYDQNSQKGTVILAPTGVYSDGNGPVMLLGDFTSTANNFIFEFQPGDYYFDSLTITGNSNEIQLPNGGSVRIFVNGPLNIAFNNTEINTKHAASAGDLFIYVNGDMIDQSSGGGTANHKAYFYVEGDVELNNNSSNWELHGGITAEGGIDINGQNPQFYQVDESDNLGYGPCHMCYDTPRGTNGRDFFSMTDPCNSTPCDFYVPVRNISPVVLDNVQITETQLSGYTMQWGNNYEVVDKSRVTVPSTSAFYNGSLYADTPMGFNIGLRNGYITYDAGDSYPIYETSTQDYYQMHKDINFRMTPTEFESLIYLGKYTDDVGRDYNVQLDICLNDACVEVQWQQDEYNVLEDFTNPIPPTKIVNTVIELPGGPVNYDVTVDYNTTDGTAIGGSACGSFTVDYISASGTVTIPGGESNVTVPITICNDAPIELDEHFFVDLSNPTPDTVCLNEHNRTKITILAQTDTPICFENDFDDGALDSLWRLLPFEEGNYVPHIEFVNGDGRLRLTPAENRIASAITKDYEFSTSQNLIIVEFDYYAYGGSGGTYGADGIAGVLFDTVVGTDSPNPGAMGGSLGYAQKDTGSDGAHPGFQGGWLGLGLDEFGNYRNPTEGRNGGEGFLENSVAIRGDGNYSYGTPATYQQQGYEYLEGTTLSNANPLANKDANDYFSGRFKMTIDARDPAHLFIRLERSLTGNEGDYSVIINQFDAKEAQYNQGTTPELVRFALTASTGGHTNIHEISWIKLRGNCQVYSTSGSYISGPFAALDTFRWRGNAPLDTTDMAISTKNVNTDFNLIIASMNEDGNAAEPKENIDVKYGIYYGSGNQIRSFENTLRDFNTSSASNPDGFITDSFTVNNADSDMHVRIFYCGDYNSTSLITELKPLSECSINNSLPSSFVDAQPELTPGLHVFYHESDHFALKPSDFTVAKSASILNNPALYKAGHDFNITFEAVDNSNNPVVDFTETVGDTFDVNVTEKKTGCYLGSFNPTITSAWQFSNTGDKTIETNYNEIGDINITISDMQLPCSGRYARIDCSDKNISGSWDTMTDTAIGEDSTSILLIPDHFDLNTTISNHRSGDFTYLSDDLNMSVDLDMNITAKELGGSTTKNYNTACYANAIDIEIDLDYSSDPTTPNALSNIHYLVTSDASSFLIAEPGSSAINDVDENDLSTTIFPSVDHNGTALLNMKINFDRKNNEPINPFDMNVTNITVTDDLNTPDNVVGTGSPISNATFYFGRAKSSQFFYNNIQTNSVNTPISVVVYCSIFPTCSELSGNIQISGKSDEPYWWLSLNHNKTIGDGNITLEIGTITPGGSASITPDGNVTVISQATDSNVNVTRNSGALPMTVNIDLDTTPNTNTHSWLIYNPFSDITASSPFYKVKFIGIMDWAGHGDTGHVVDTDTSIKKNIKLGW